MKGNRIFLQLFSIAFLSFIFSACSPGLFEKSKQIEIGMTKQEIITLMGKDYEVTSLDMVEGNKEEILRYYIPITGSSAPSYYSLFYFTNNKLVKIKQQDIPRIYNGIPVPTPVTTTEEKKD